MASPIRIKDISRTVTTAAANEYLAVDGPSGSGKMLTPDPRGTAASEAAAAVAGHDASIGSHVGFFPLQATWATSTELKTGSGVAPAISNGMHMSVYSGATANSTAARTMANYSFGTIAQVGQPDVAAITTALDFSMSFLAARGSTASATAKARFGIGKDTTTAVGVWALDGFGMEFNHGDNSLSGFNFDAGVLTTTALGVAPAGTVAFKFEIRRTNGAFQFFVNNEPRGSITAPAKVFSYQSFNPRVEIENGATAAGNIFTISAIRWLSKV